MLDTKLSPWPSFGEEEINAVKDVLSSGKVNYWTGDEGREFEKEFGEAFETKNAIAVANGTVALELALRALDIKAGDEVIVTPRSFIASVSCVVNVGATPVFADVDLNSQNIEANTIEPMITEKTKAVIVVHLAGMPADMDAIMELANSHGFSVIEDCAQAHGAFYRGRSLGSIGDIGVWSFCQDKIMTTGGEGGMVATNNYDLWKKMWSFKDHGKNFDCVYHRKHPPGFRWLHDQFGTNWRMTEMQSAIGRVQLRKLSKWSENRRKNASMLDSVAREFPLLRLSKIPADYKHAAYKHYFFVNPKYLAEGWTRNKIVDELVHKGVPCFHGSCAEVYLEKAFESTPWRPKERLANAKELGETSLMMLVHPTISQDEMAKCCRVLQDILHEASK